MEILIALVVFLFDQVSKLWVQSQMLPKESIPLIPGYFHLSYVQNPGAAFGILKKKIFFFVSITILVVCLIIYLIPRIPKDQPLLRFASGLILGGAMGNLIDRIRLGYVIDFLDFRIWPVFNIADAAVVVGVLILSWFMMIKQPEGFC